MAESARQRCIAPGAVSGEDLVAWIRGTAGERIQDHLSRCAFCRDEAGAFARGEAVLSGLLFRRSCPPSLTLGEYALGILAPDEALAVAQHLLECPHCAEERRRFAAFLAEPDEPLPAGGPVARLLRRLFAQPVSAPALALRGDDDEDIAAYAVDGYQLTLSVQAADRGAARSIVGLLIGGTLPAAGAAVHLYAGDRLTQTAALDDLGNFILDGVAAGSYRLELVLGDTEVIVDPLHVA